MSTKQPGQDPDKPAPAGHVRHDPSGRAVWEWAADAGRQALDSTSRLLKRLDLPGLTLEGEEKKKPEAAPKPVVDAAPQNPVKPVAGGGHSFDPYDNRSPPKRPAPIAKAPVPRTAAPVSPKKKPGFFARLFGGKG